MSDKINQNGAQIYILILKNHDVRYNCSIIDLHDRSVIASITDRHITSDLAIPHSTESIGGLKFDGRTITGTPVVEDDNWDGDNGMFKTVTLKFKAKKNGVMLVRKYKYWIYRDKDRDGIADDDEDGGTAFTPQRHNSKPLVVDGKEPTLDDYKALFSNIPADGSVKVSIKQKPDLSKKERQERFSSSQ